LNIIWGLITEWVQL